MILKWTRESMLVLFTLVMVLLAIFYYGNLLIIEPVRVTADTSAQIIAEQEALIEIYPPSDELRQELERDYSETANFIPSGERINEAMILIQQTGESNGVDLVSMSRLNDNQTVEGLNDNFLRSTYQIELESTSAENMRNMLSQLNGQDRLWNSQLFSYQREGDEVVTGNLIIDLYYRMPINH